MFVRAPVASTGGQRTGHEARGESRLPDHHCNYGLGGAHHSFLRQNRPEREGYAAVGERTCRKHSTLRSSANPNVASASTHAPSVGYLPCRESSRQPRPDVADGGAGRALGNFGKPNERDPIGLAGFGHDPGDEYDSYAGSIFTALFDGGRETEVWLTLERALRNLGLGPAHEREEVLAMRIVSWWQESSPDGQGAFRQMTPCRRRASLLLLTLCDSAPSPVSRLGSRFPPTVRSSAGTRTDRAGAGPSGSNRAVEVACR